MKRARHRLRGVVIAFGLLGVNRWSELDRSYLHPAPAVEATRTLGAFPLLSIADETFY